MRLQASSSPKDALLPGELQLLICYLKLRMKGMSLTWFTTELLYDGMYVFKTQFCAHNLTATITVQNCLHYVVNSDWNENSQWY